jgi:hypothetical protein
MAHSNSVSGSVHSPDTETRAPASATRAPISGNEPLVVSPRRARQMLDVGNTRLYELLNEKKLDSYLDGRARKITVASIHRYIADRLQGGDD